jgi:hypothetical protein
MNAIRITLRRGDGRERPAPVSGCHAASGSTKSSFLANSHARELLQCIASRYPISVHTVGVSIEGADGVDDEHLTRVRELVDAVDPILSLSIAILCRGPRSYSADPTRC